MQSGGDTDGVRSPKKEKVGRSPNGLGTIVDGSAPSTSHGRRTGASQAGAVEKVPDESRLENELTNEKLMRLQAIFEEADEDGGGGLDMEEFRKAMRQTMGGHVSDEFLDMIFMKVDTNCDGTVDWEEYLTYMLLECREKDLMQVQELQPFPRDFQVAEGEHKDSLVRILYLPNLIQEGQIGQRFYGLDDHHGRYVSASKEGVITFWCQDLKTNVTRRVDPLPPQKSIWITDMAVMPRANMVVISTTNRTLQFYDISGNRFERVSMVNDLNSCPMCMTYWSHRTSYCEPLLIVGDADGGISVIRFKKCPSMTVFNPKRSKSKRQKFSFDEILSGSVKLIEGVYFPDVHGDMVKHVVYSDKMDMIISCSKDSRQSLCCSELKQMTDSTFISVQRGINTFDYSYQLNVLVTGGYDSIVRVWNPYMTSKPVITLEGHKSAILHVIINHIKEQVISISENKEIRVHDMNTQACIQTFYKKMMPELGPRTINVAMFNNTQQTLIIGTTSLALIQQKLKEVKQLTTHEKQINVVIYNPLFNQIVTGGVDSLVCVWSATTGEKMMQFKAHTIRRHAITRDVEITAMAFDPTFRRLLTAARDGSAKIWNFNNGACLREIPSPDTREITAIICPKDRIATAGWNKSVSLYRDMADDETCKVLRPPLSEDILTLAYYPPNLIAAGSQDGSILVWSLDTKRLVFFTRVGGSGKPESFSILEHLVGMSSKNSSSNKLALEQLFNTEYSVGPQGPHMGESVEKLLFLPKRGYHKDTAILFAACNDGYIRAYSVHREGGLKGQFQATSHHLTTMITNASNELLITGDSAGYISVWDISHHFILGGTCDIDTHQSRLSYWETFTYFRLKELKRNIDDNSWYLPFKPSHDRPHLLSRFQAHLGPILSMDFAQLYNKEMMVSCSTDCSVRMWALTGQFVGIVGQATEWQEPQTSGERSRAATGPPILPPDVRRVASSTTLRVINGGKPYYWKLAQTIITWLNKYKHKSSMQPTTDITEIVSQAQQSDDDLSGDERDENILGKSYMKRTNHRPLPVLTSPLSPFPQCPAYRSLPFAEVESIKLDDVCDTTELKRIQETYKLPSLKHETRLYQPSCKKVGWLVHTGTVAATARKSIRKVKKNQDSNNRTARLQKRRLSLFHRYDEEDDQQTIRSKSNDRQLSFADDIKSNTTVFNTPPKVGSRRSLGDADSSPGSSYSSPQSKVRLSSISDFSDSSPSLLGSPLRGRSSKPRPSASDTDSSPVQDHSSPRNRHQSSPGDSRQSPSRSRTVTISRRRVSTGDLANRALNTISEV